LGVPVGDGVAASAAPAQEVNPRAVAAWSAACLAITLSTTNPAYRALVLGAALVVVVAGAGARRARRLLYTAALAGVSAVAFNFVLSHLGADVLFSLPDQVPVLGGPYTLEAVVFGVVSGITLAAAMLAVAPLVLLLDPDHLIDALPGFLHRTGGALAATLNLIPSLGGTFRAVADAQRLRGWRPRGPRSWSEIVVPVVLTAIEDSIQLAESMEARAFGSGPRTRLEPARMSAADWLSVAVAGSALALFVLAALTGQVGDWFAYPTLQVPSLSRLPALACLLLAVPALLWRSPPSAD
jgi:energy-coupling factor transport system permease protein